METQSICTRSCVLQSLRFEIQTSTWTRCFWRVSWRVVCLVCFFLCSHSVKKVVPFVAQLKLKSTFSCTLYSSRRYTDGSEAMCLWKGIASEQSACACLHEWVCVFVGVDVFVGTFLTPALPSVSFLPFHSPYITAWPPHNYNIILILIIIILFLSCENIWARACQNMTTDQKFDFQFFKGHWNKNWTIIENLS